MFGNRVNSMFVIFVWKFVSLGRFVGVGCIIVGYFIFLVIGEKYC